MLLKTTLVFALLNCASNAFAGVLIVGGVSQTHANLQLAVDAASSGDVILVRNTVVALVLSPITVDGKGIAIVADVPNRLDFQPGLLIKNLPAGSTALLSGFHFTTTYSTNVVIHDNLGAVRIQDCDVAPFAGQTPSIPGVQCTACADVAIVGCDIQGGVQPYQTAGGGAPGVRSISSKIVIQGSQIRGGNGPNGYVQLMPGPPTLMPGQPGGYGIEVSGGEAVLIACQLQGGSGGNGMDGGWPPPTCSTFDSHPTWGGNGGGGVRLMQGANARAFGTTFSVAAGGAGGSNPCGAVMPAGSAGVPVDAQSGTWSESPAVTRSIAAPRIVRAGAPLPLSFTGSPGDALLLLSSLQPAHTPLPQLEGVLLTQGPYRRLQFGVFDAQGSVAVTLPTPALPSGVTNELLHLQSVAVDPSGQARLGFAVVVVRVHPSY